MAEIAKIDEEKRQVFGWAYTTHDKNGNLIIDKSGEFVDDPDELEKTAIQFVLNSRNGGAFHMRDSDDKAIVKSTLVESMVFTPEKKKALGLSENAIPTGWWVGFQVDDKDTWDLVKSGKLTSFSIHGKGTKKEVTE